MMEKLTYLQQAIYERYHLDGGHCTVTFRDSKLRGQILDDLKIGNAHKYTVKMGSRGGEPGDYVRLEIVEFAHNVYTKEGFRSVDPDSQEYEKLEDNEDLIHVHRIRLNGVDLVEMHDMIMLRICEQHRFMQKMDNGDVFLRSLLRQWGEVLTFDSDYHEGEDPEDSGWWYDYDDKEWCITRKGFRVWKAKQQAQEAQNEKLEVDDIQPE
jgi:hypothetical protein